MVTAAAMGPKVPRSTVLRPEEEALVVAFRRHTLLPLDDGLYALQATIPHLTRSSLPRCCQRHGIGRLPEIEGDTPKKAFKSDVIGLFHIDVAELRTEEGKRFMLVAIDRTSKLAFAELHDRATRRVAADFRRRLVAAVPDRVHTVLTDNGTHVTDPTGDGSTPSDIRTMRDAGETFRCHAFEPACADNDIDHRLTKPNHPWTNGQVERMNRTLKAATVRRSRVTNRPACDRGLVGRGDLRLWIADDALAAWAVPRRRTRGGQARFSDLAIETLLVLASVFRLPLRQAEGFMRSILAVMGLELPKLDHTTLARRRRGVPVEMNAPGRQGPVDLVLDSTGLTFHGPGEWDRRKHGEKRRAWRKLRLAVDAGTGEILAHEPTDGDTADAAMAGSLVARAGGRIRSVIADGAY